MNVISDEKNLLILENVVQGVESIDRSKARCKGQERRARLGNKHATRRAYEVDM